MATLRDYIKIKHGFAFKGDYITTVDNNVVLVTPGNFAIGGGFKEEKCKYFNGVYSDEYVLNPDDLIVTMTDLSKQIDTLGYSALIPNNENGRVYLHNQRIGLVTIDKDKIDKHYLYWFMRTPYYQKTIASTATGSTVHHTSPSRILDVKIILPELNIQKKIARFFDTIEEKISMNIEMNKILEKQAQIIFDKMFGNTILANKCIGDIIIPKRGKSLLSKNAINGGVPVVGGGLEPSTFHNISNTTAPVLAISASGANAGYISLWNVPIWASDSSYIDSTMTDDVYFWYVLLKKRQNEVFDLQTGSAQPHVYPKHIASMSIPEFNKDDIQKYTSCISPFFEKIGQNKEENLYLIQLREILLPKLISGEIDISKMNI